MKRLLIIILIGVIFFSGCITLNDDRSDDGKESYSLLYNLQVKNTTNLSFSLIVPIPIHLNGSLAITIEDIEVISGVAEFNIIITDHGYALNLSGIRDFEILANIDNPSKFDIDNGLSHLSMDKHMEDSGEYNPTEENAEYYAYYNSSMNNGIDIMIELKSEYINTKSNVAVEYGERQVINASIINGWNVVEGKKHFWLS